MNTNSIHIDPEELAANKLALLKELMLQKKGLSFFAIHHTFRLSPTEMFEFVDILKQEEIIRVIGEDTILLTPEGENWILKHKDYIYLQPKFKAWKMLPPNMIKPPHQGLYLPNEDKIDKKFFNKLK